MLTDTVPAAEAAWNMTVVLGIGGAWSNVPIRIEMARGVKICRTLTEDLMS